MLRQTLNLKDDALWQAVTHRDIEAVKRAVRNGGNVNSISPDGWVDAANAGSGGKSLLHHAAWVGDVDIFVLLVENGADIDARRQKNWSTPRGNTAMHSAAFYNRHEIVQYCIENGADVNLQGEQGYTCLHLASMYGYEKMVQLLLERGARTDMLTKNERTPIHVAKTPEIRGMLEEHAKTHHYATLPTRAEAAWNAGQRQPPLARRDSGSLKMASSMMTSNYGLSERSSNNRNINNNNSYANAMAELSSNDIWKTSSSAIGSHSSISSRVPTSRRRPSQ